MGTALFLALIIVSIALIVAVMIQGRGSLSGGIFGGDSMYTSRRGAERTLFNATIGLSVVFVLLNLITFLYAG